MTKASKHTVGRGAAYIYMETITSMISGYVFWIIMSKISSTNIIGTSSAVVSLAGIFAVVAGIGISTGIQRSLGKNFADQKITDARVFFKTSLVLVSVGIMACTFVILLLGDWMKGTFGIDFNLLLIAILLIGSTVTSMLFRAVLISSLNTSMLPPIMIVSALAKIGLAVFLVILGAGALGLTIGYTFYQVLTAIFLSIFVITIFKQKEGQNTGSVGYIGATKEILSASVVSWIPLLVTAVGSQLGTVVVFGSEGSNQAGVYFIALTIVTGILSIMLSLFTIALPTLSAMHDGRKRFAWQTIRLSAIIVLPFSTCLIFYSEQILQLLGRDYTEGALSLEILLISMLPSIVMYGIHTLVYSYGHYRQVLLIGLATSIPRTLLYFLLVPLYGGAGAAMGYTIGSIVGFVISIAIARKVSMQLFWKDLIFITFIPVCIAIAFEFLSLNYVVSMIGILVISYALLFKVRVLLRNDIVYLLSILPHTISLPLRSMLRRIEKKLDRLY